MSKGLAVIGFDAQLDGLENVDRVAAAFYLGEPYQTEPALRCITSKPLLYQSTLTCVLHASGLVAQQIAVIIIDPDQSTAIDEGNFIQISTVSSFVDSIELSALLIEKFDCAVLIVTAHIAKQVQQQTLASFSYDQQFDHYGENSGVASVLLANEHFALTHRCYVYSYISAYSVTNDLSNIGQTIERTFKQAKLTPSDIASLDVSAPRDQSLSHHEEAAILSQYANSTALSTSLSCIKSVIGDCAALSDMCGFLNSVFALQQRYYCGVKQWQAPRDSQLSAWQSSPFYVLNECATAFPKTGDLERNNAFSCLTESQYAHFIIRENNDQTIHPNGFNVSCDLSLFIIHGKSKDDLIAQLTLLDNNVDKSDFRLLAEQYYQASLKCTKPTYCLVIVASSKAGLKSEINLAQTGISFAFEQAKDWKTPQGSYLCISPEVDTKTCFLYPGIGATYLGLGQDLLQLFPALYPCIEALVKNSATEGIYQLLQPRSVTRLTTSQLKDHDLALRTKLSDIAECGVGYACVFTYLFQTLLNVKADLAAGYSMGEVSMFAALNCWENPGQMSTRLASSTTFNNQLAGELNAVRTLWDMPNTGQLIWESYNIKGNLEQVKNAIQPNERVYITLINTLDSLVIAGFPNDCLAVAKRLGVRAMALNVHNAIHCSIADQQFEQMVELYSMPLADPIPTKLYSSSCYLPIPFNQKAIAVSIAKCLSQPVDFPRMIKTLKQQGATMFIEMGAGRSLGTWVDKILSKNDDKCMTVAINAKGASQQLMLMRAVAKMLSAGVALDLSNYFYGSIIVNNRASND